MHERINNPRRICFRKEQPSITILAEDIVSELGVGSMQNYPGGTSQFGNCQSAESPLARAKRFSALPILELNSSEQFDADWLDSDTAILTTALKRPRSCGVRGDTLFCSCPACSAALSVRLWLCTVDCWCCGASIEVSQLTSEVAQKNASTANDPQYHSVAPLLSDFLRPGGSLDQLAERLDDAPVPARKSMRRLRTARLVDLFDNMPAWLTSLLLHLALLILLALLHFRTFGIDESITLSTAIGPADREDVDARFVDPIDNIEFDLPVPDADRPTNNRQRNALILANQQAKELRIDPDEPHPELPDISHLKRVIGSDPDRRALAVRDPRIRVEMIRREGGTTLTEAAVARGLSWMANHQDDDGSWSLHAFHRTHHCRGRCGGQGSARSDSAATSLCLLPFLGAGQTHLTGKYKEVVSTGLRWLIEIQKENGDLRGGSHGHQAGMYAHGQGAIVLCEAFGLTKDESLRKPAQKAIDFIVAAQHRRGGWRYSPGEEGDTSVFGWQLMALQSARAAGLDVPDATLARADRFLDSVSSAGGSRYAYRPRQRSTPVMTAEALLCRMYLGWTIEEPGLRNGIVYLANSHMPNARSFNIYYWYYATQVMHHAGGRPWRFWNERMREILVKTQQKSGHEAGSWPPRGPHAGVGGRLYVTALAVCTLEVYYRHAPIFRQIDIQ